MGRLKTRENSTDRHFLLVGGRATAGRVSFFLVI